VTPASLISPEYMNLKISSSVGYPNLTHGASLAVTPKYSDSLSPNSSATSAYAK